MPPGEPSCTTAKHSSTTGLQIRSRLLRSASALGIGICGKSLRWRDYGSRISCRMHCFRKFRECSRSYLIEPNAEFVMRGAFLFPRMAGSDGCRSELRSATGFASSGEWEFQLSWGRVAIDGDLYGLVTSMDGWMDGWRDMGSRRLELEVHVFCVK